LFEDILNRFPAKRVKDLVIFDPTDQENPPGLNLFEYDRRNPLHRDFVLDEAVAIFLRLHGNEMFGPRIQNYFRNAALALMGDPSRERTLLDLSRVFIDDQFYEYAMDASTDPAVADFISEFRKTAEREKAEMIPYFQAKFTPFVSNSGFVPTALLRNLEHNKVHHAQIVILHVEIQRVPRTDPLCRVIVEELLPNVYDVRARFGFMETPDVGEAIRNARRQGLKVFAEDSSFFLGWHLVRARPRPGFPGLKSRAFAFLQRRSAQAAEFFNMPTRGVVVLATEIEL